MQRLQRAKRALAVCRSWEKLVWGSVLGSKSGPYLCSPSPTSWENGASCVIVLFFATWLDFRSLCRAAFTAETHAFTITSPPCPNLLQSHLPKEPPSPQPAAPWSSLLPQQGNIPPWWHSSSSGWRGYLAAVGALCEVLFKIYLNIDEGYGMFLQSINIVHNSIHFCHIKWGLCWII